MKMKRRLCLGLALLLGAMFLPAGCGGAGGAAHALTGVFLDVGKADAIVLTCAGETLLIDAGETDDGDEVLSYLREQNAAAVDVLIITHFDKDHVGGAAALMAGIPVKRVLVPDYTGSSAEYRSFISAAADAGITPEALTQRVSFSLGDAEVTVDPPGDYSAAGSTDDADNDLSLITTVTHGRNRLLFTGDAENARLNEWLDGGNARSCTLVKLPHHGVYHKALKDLLTATSPSCAVICDSEKNPAEDKTKNLLLERGVEVYETKDGIITAVSDGKRIDIGQG